MIKNLQAFYNKDSKMIMEQANQDEAAVGSLNFLINLATLAMVADDKVTIQGK